MAQVIQPVMLYLGIALGAVGVWLALPRKTISPQIIGGLIAAIGAGLVVLGLSLKAHADEGAIPNLYFYVFAAVGLGASLRVITHPRPVYAALYFILTILSSGGLFLILSAEFMAFAMVIIYAGAILITYLFVIMLATQAPTEEQVSALAGYDAQAREPLIAAGAGFVILAALTTMVFSGVGRLPSPDQILAGSPGGDAVLAQLPGRVERALRWLPKDDPARLAPDETIVRDDAGHPMIDTQARTATVGVEVEGPDGQRLYEDHRLVSLPDSLHGRNIEALAMDFLNGHPGSIEIAGVVLLMAMLGAVVLARRQVEIDEDAKAAQSGLDRHLSTDEQMEA